MFEVHLMRVIIIQIPQPHFIKGYHAKCQSEKRFVRSLKKSDESDLIPMDLSDLTMDKNRNEQLCRSHDDGTISDCNFLKPWKASSENDLTLFESNTQFHCLNWNEMENDGKMEASEVFKTREEYHIKCVHLV